MSDKLLGRTLGDEEGSALDATNQGFTMLTWAGGAKYPLRRMLLNA